MRKIKVNSSRATACPIKSSDDEPTESRFWLSWWAYESDKFNAPFAWPTWSTGSRGDEDARQVSLCAAVIAGSEEDAWGIIRAAYLPGTKLEQRFCNERPESWTPFEDHFQREDWMQWPESDAEWAAIAGSAPSSDEIRAIAQYLLETGQAAT